MRRRPEAAVTSRTAFADLRPMTRTIRNCGFGSISGQSTAFITGPGRQFDCAGLLISRARYSGASWSISSEALDYMFA